MSIIEKNAIEVKELLERLNFENEHPDYGKEINEKLDEIIIEAQTIRRFGTRYGSH